AYRRGDALQPDVQLVAALERVGAVEQAALAALTEAAIAWRGGDVRCAGDLAATAARFCVGPGMREAFLLARALQCVATSTPPPPEEAARLSAEACASRLPRVGAQVLALLARSGAAVPAEAQRVLAAAASAAAAPAQRLEVLALDECRRELKPPA